MYVNLFKYSKENKLAIKFNLYIHSERDLESLEEKRNINRCRTLVGLGPGFRSSL